MNKIFKIQKTLAFLLALLCVLAIPGHAFATDLSVTADMTSVKSGDKITLTIIVKGEHIAVVRGIFTYDPSLLSYIGSDGGASDGHISIVSAEKGGSSSLTAVIRFLARNEGAAVIEFSMEEVLSYDEKSLGKAEAGVSIAIQPNPNDTGVGASPSSGAPAADLSKTGVAAKNVMGTTMQMYIWRSLKSLTLPAGFTDRQIEYGGEYVGGAAIPDNDDLILLYLSEKAGENAGYYIYDNDKNILFPYLKVSSVLADFTIVWPDDSVEVPKFFEKTALELNKKFIPAWTLKDSDAPLYLLYARNSSGETGFFLYNTEDKSVQRYVEFPEAQTESAAEPASMIIYRDKTGSGISIDINLFIVLCAAMAALIIASVSLAVLYIKKGSPGKKEKAKAGKEQNQAKE